MRTNRKRKSNNYKRTRLFVVMETYFCIAFPFFQINRIYSNLKWKYLKKAVPSSYFERKREVVSITEQLLKEENTKWFEWFLLQDKKDDLADAYIQSLYYVIKDKGTFNC